MFVRIRYRICGDGVLLCLDHSSCPVIHAVQVTWGTCQTSPGTTSASVLRAKDFFVEYFLFTKDQWDKYYGWSLKLVGYGHDVWLLFAPRILLLDSCTPLVEASGPYREASSVLVQAGGAVRFGGSRSFQTHSMDWNTLLGSYLFLLVLWKCNIFDWFCRLWNLSDCI